MMQTERIKRLNRRLRTFRNSERLLIEQTGAIAQAREEFIEYVAQLPAAEIYTAQRMARKLLAA